MIGYEELRLLAAPFGHDDFDPSAYVLAAEVAPQALTRLALEVVHTSTVFTSPTPSDLDVAAIFVQGFQLGLAVRRPP